MRDPMRKGVPLGLEEMQQRQAEMEDRINAMHAELQARATLFQAAMLVVEKARVWDEESRTYVEKGWFHTNSPAHGEVAEAIAQFDALRHGKDGEHGKITIAFEVG